MLDKYKQELIKSIAQSSPLSQELIEKLLEKPKSQEHGDLAIPCFPLAKQWQISPPECAKRLAEQIELPQGFSESIVVGPYINFRFDKQEIIKTVIPQLLQAGDNVGAQKPHGKQVIVEYSSPNIAKTFHVGHLRTTLIGHSLVQIYNHLGYKTIGINHLGDWGTQFGFVWAGCEIWGKPKEESVDALVEIYQRATKLRKQQDSDTVPDEDKATPDINQLAREYFVRLEAEESEAFTFWKWCLDISLSYLKQQYTRLGITFDHYTGESFYRDMLESVEQKIKDAGILEESKGALGIDLGKKLGFARIFTEDGRSLYITRDIATALYRQETYDVEKILYVVAAQQSLHFKQLVGILEKMDNPVAEKINHLGFGFVPGMSTREGGAISLKHFLTEATQRAQAAYESEVSRKPDTIDVEKVAEAVAIGATYYYFLSHVNVKDFQFSWEQALNFQGDSGPYLQYAVARINSIEQKASDAGIKIAQEIDPNALNTDEAFLLVKKLAAFEESVQKACAENEPYHIATHMLEIAKGFSKAYQVLRVVGEQQDVASSRLALFIATRNVLSTGLKLIGVPIINRM